MAVRFWICFGVAISAFAQTATIPSIADKTHSMTRIDGFVPLYWDGNAGTLWMEISRFDQDFLYTTGLSAGLGSNDIGLDRGQEGRGAVVHFERIGPKVLLVENNQSFRSSSANPAERKSVEDSFARSVLAGFKITAQTGDAVLVDATAFFVRDAHGAASSLKPGSYRVDPDRSAIYLPRTKGFPRNTEVDVTLTFARGSEPEAGGFGAGPAQGPPAIGRGGGRAVAPRGDIFSGTVGSVTPDAESVTLREHHSFVQLPDTGYTPRTFDPRSGFIETEYADFSLPMSESIVRRYIIRHRLIHKAGSPDPVEPIRYYVDPGAPADIRQALIEGASWWNTAFEAAGFRNAFQVALLPDGADPMDIRYNMINWVHRSTRGWSMGGSIADPRTGEIIKATVTLGSLRDRQDYLIFEGLLSPYQTGTERPDALYQTALARIRQLAAHEVGHTLGLMHNYYDSSKGWISVMDYPHPQEALRPDGTIDLSHAYPARIGDWDKVAINWGYREYRAEGEERAALPRVFDEAQKADLRFLTNQDTDVHPLADQWSNGRDQTEELARIMKIRRAALDRIGEQTIRTGAPLATIEEALVPIYMYHRYSVESAASNVGGMNYAYSLRGDVDALPRWQTGDQQRKALDVLATTLRPAELAVSRKVLDLIPPRPYGYGAHRELFPRTTGRAFDPLAPASVAADVTIGFVLQLDRAARVVAQHAVDASLPGLDEVIQRLASAVFDAPAASPYEAEIRRVEERVLVDRVAWLATGSPNSQVRAIASAQLEKIGARAATDPDKAHGALIVADIRRILNRPGEPWRPIFAPDAPPGAPIGGESGPDWLARPPYGQ